MERPLTPDRGSVPRWDGAKSIGAAPKRLTLHSVDGAPIRTELCMALTIVITGKNRRFRAMATLAAAACSLAAFTSQARAADGDSALLPAPTPVEMSLTIPAPTEAVTAPFAPATAFAGRTEIDRMRALDCLAQA